MDIFSSRELATGFWLIMVLAFLIYSASIRPYLKNLIKSFCNIYILTPIIGMGIYIALISYFLIECDIWNFNQYKNVTLWLIFVGIYSLFQVADSNRGMMYFKETIANLFKITTLFEFIVAFYSFSFWFEFFLIPFMTFIIVMTTFSENNKEYKLVSETLGKLILSIGLCIITYVCYQLLSEPEAFFNEGTVYDFVVPIILTIAIFPYLYLVMIYAEYNRLALRLKISFKDNVLVRYAKVKTILAFNFRFDYLKRWDRYIMLHDIKSTDDIDSSIKRIIYLMKRDKKIIPVSFNKGWPHYDARRYLKEYGLMTSYYDHLYYEKWSTSSEYLKLGEGYFCNKIKYYIDGDEEAVKCLTLVLEVEDKASFQEALGKFSSIGNCLVEKSISKNKQLSIKAEEIEDEHNELNETYLSEIEGRNIMIQKRKFVNRDDFELILSFAVDKESFKYIDDI